MKIWRCGWLLALCLVACQDDVNDVVKEKLDPIHDLPSEPDSLPIPKNPPVLTGYRQMGKDPFVNPYHHAVTTNTPAHQNQSSDKSSDEVAVQHPSADTIRLEADVKPWENVPKTAESLPKSDTKSSQSPVIKQPKPAPARNKEPLEYQSLSQLSYRGRVLVDGRWVALVFDQHGLMYELVIGGYLGQNQGKLIAIDEQKLSILERVDGQERTVYLPLAP
ncbi:pilus assembly protein PilP [Moraxella nasicaprae]|uniref:Pilus assembly protein PilP n=1 Tax=Moraxella nasicaprae TaxID=2904122 RepID=A0ABY6F2Y6_9GAMM|nr:pilus assembly protein PilP [Moraxella nasicaprae]UXZ04456.1 pilus assembly protein PilP [Moraxella nasicaprae]